MFFDSFISYNLTTEQQAKYEDTQPTLRIAISSCRDSQVLSSKLL